MARCYDPPVVSLRGALSKAVEFPKLILLILSLASVFRGHKHLHFEFPWNHRPAHVSEHHIAAFVPHSVRPDNYEREKGKVEERKRVILEIVGELVERCPNMQDDLRMIASSLFSEDA